MARGMKGDSDDGWALLALKSAPASPNASRYWHPSSSCINTNSGGGAIVAKLEGRELEYLIRHRQRKIVIGRNSSRGDVDVNVGHSSFVSRKHVEIIFRHPDFYMTCNGKNGVFVDGIFQRKGAPPIRLPKICTLRFPSTSIKLVFQSLVNGFSDGHSVVQEGEEIEGMEGDDYDDDDIIGDDKSPSSLLPFLANRHQTIAHLRKYPFINVFPKEEEEEEEEQGEEDDDEEKRHEAADGEYRRRVEEQEQEEADEETRRKFSLMKSSSSSNVLMMTPLHITIPSSQDANIGDSPFPSPTGTISAANSCPASPRGMTNMNGGGRRNFVDELKMITAYTDVSYIARSVSLNLAAAAATTGSCLENIIRPSVSSQDVDVCNTNSNRNRNSNPDVVVAVESSAGVSHPSPLPKLVIKDNDGGVYSGSSRNSKSNGRIAAVTTATAFHPYFRPQPQPQPQLQLQQFYGNNSKKSNDNNNSNYNSSSGDSRNIVDVGTKNDATSVSSLLLECSGNGGRSPYYCNNSNNDGNNGNDNDNDDDDDNNNNNNNCNSNGDNNNATIVNSSSNNNKNNNNSNSNNNNEEDEGKGESKPPYSYAQLIVQAVASSAERQLTLSGIYSYITKHYPYYRTADKGWQNSIRHNLSLNRYFLKVPRSQDEPGKGSFWRIDPQSENKLIEQAFRKRRQRGVACFRTTPPFCLSSRSAPASPTHHMSTGGSISIATTVTPKSLSRSASPPVILGDQSSPFFINEKQCTQMSSSSSPAAAPPLSVNAFRSAPVSPVMNGVTTTAATTDVIAFSRSLGSFYTFNHRHYRGSEVNHTQTAYHPTPAYHRPAASSRMFSNDDNGRDDDSPTQVADGGSDGGCCGSDDSNNNSSNNNSGNKHGEVTGVNDNGSSASAILSSKEQLDVDDEQRDDSGSTIGKGRGHYEFVHSAAADSHLEIFSNRVTSSQGAAAAAVVVLNDEKVDCSQIETVVTPTTIAITTAIITSSSSLNDGTDTAAVNNCAKKRKLLLPDVKEEEEEKEEEKKRRKVKTVTMIV